MTTRTQDNTAALDAFMAHKATVDHLLAQLVEASDGCFEASPDRVNWGHVGSLEMVEQRLRECVRFVGGEA